jgi:hypothetical protein
MSIKVHNGYRVRGGESRVADLTRLLKVLGTLREPIKACQRQEVARLYARRASFLIDDVCFGMPLALIPAFDGSDLVDQKDPESWRRHSALSYFETCAMTAQNRADRKGIGVRSPEYDWECTVIIYILPEVDEVLFRFITEQSAYMERCRSTLMMFESFSYFGGTDHVGQVDDHGDPLTAEDWKRRHDLWDLTDKPDQLLGGVPVQLTLADVYGAYPLEADILRSQPTFDERLSRMAEKFARHDYAQRHPVSKDQDRSGSISAVLRHNDYATEWLKTEDGTATLAGFRNNILEQMIGQYNLNDLRRPLTLWMPDSDLAPAT